MKLILKSKAFWASTLVIIAVIFASLLNLNRTYKSRIDVMLIPKSQIAAEQLGSLVNNAKYLTKTLSFYDELVKYDPKNGAKTSELSDNQRENEWNSQINIKRLEEGSIIRIAITDNNRTLAEAISQKTALNLAKSLSLYYDIRTELDTRIIGSPITVYTWRYSILTMTVAAIILGLVITFIIFFLSTLLSDLIEKKYLLQPKKIKLPDFLRPAAKTIENEPYIFKAELDKQLLEEMLPKKKTSVLADKKTPKTSPSFSAKSAAPDNLPVEEMPAYMNGEKEKQSEPAKKIETSDIVEPIIREATPEEVKERLNKLLSGKF